MSEQPSDRAGSEPTGIDHPLDAGVSDEQDLAPGSDAAADADPSGDVARFADVARERSRDSAAGEPPG